VNYDTPKMKQALEEITRKIEAARTKIDEQRRVGGPLNVMDPVDDADAPTRFVPPRIVCTDCPATATMHACSSTYGPIENASTLEVWVECHGEHFYGTVLAGSQTSQQTGKKRALTIADVSIYDESLILSKFEHAERSMQEQAERAALYERYLKRPR
jgi:hypothetical protein